jgi:spore photoproduct lyase
VARMKFELDALLIEEASRTSALAARVTAALPAQVTVHYVADGRESARPQLGPSDPFGAGKRRMILMRRRGAFLMGCPAGSNEFACCGYLVMVLASNCPMDCSYCFLQEYVADNPGLQIYTNYTDVVDELDRLGRREPTRSLRIGTGELADSLAFDSMTAISRDLVAYFATRENLLLELKTKTDEIDNLLTIDPKGRTLVSWTLSSERVFRSSEQRTATPAARIEAARQVLAAGYKIAFHLDPIIAYPEAENDYAAILENVFDVVAPERIAFISMGGLRMTPALRAHARRRFPADAMLLGEEVLGADGRYRAFTPLRLKLFTQIRERIAAANPRLPIYLCMESPSAHQRVLGAAPPPAAQLGARLAGD